jgi:hypothetical protein
LRIQTAQEESQRSYRSEKTMHLLLHDARPDSIDPQEYRKIKDITCASPGDQFIF